MLGLAAGRARHRAIALLAREHVHARARGAVERAAGVRQVRRATRRPGQGAGRSPRTRSPITIAAPLTADHWRDLLQLPDRADLFAALISNRSALLVCAGRDGRRSLDARRCSSAIADCCAGSSRTAPAAFWVAARSLKIDKDRVVVPGGAAAEPIWEALVGEQGDAARGFRARAAVARLRTPGVVLRHRSASMTPERPAAAFGAGPIEAQIEQARALLRAPFDRRIRTGSSRSIRSCAARPIRGSSRRRSRSPTAPWRRPPRSGSGRSCSIAPRSSRRAAASLRRDARPRRSRWRGSRRRSSSVAAKERRDRYEMVRFAQARVPERRAATTPSTCWSRSAAIAAIARMLLSLDRMEITTPRVYARAVEAARRLDELSGRDAQARRDRLPGVARDPRARAR